MSPHTEKVRRRLFAGPTPPRQLIESIGLSQPTLSRALSELGSEVIRIGAARSIQYALRDASRGLPDIPIYRVNTDGRIQKVGTLIPVRPDGFVMFHEIHESGGALHSEGLPWWLFDMRPQGYLGRAYAARHGAGLGLPARLGDWTDTHVLRALLAHGHDAVGNLLLGDTARDHFLGTVLNPISAENKTAEYARLAHDAAHGEIPGSSAGGEQPKFTACVLSEGGPRQVIVKFSEREAGPVSERWRDLLLAEHHALETLREAGIPAARTRIVDHAGQRFLEVERFDRIGELGRCAVISLSALDSEFLGIGASAWPIIAQRLMNDGHLRPEAADCASLLWAFGTLIGNTDMHGGNLSFIADNGRPYDIAPAYDMTPMAFAPRSGGGLPDTLQEANIHASVPSPTWRHAEALARTFLARLMAEFGFSQRFAPAIAALHAQVETASIKIKRLG